MWPKLPSLPPPELHWMMLCYVGGQSHIFKSNKLTHSAKDSGHTTQPFPGKYFNLLSYLQERKFMTTGTGAVQISWAIIIIRARNIIRMPRVSVLSQQSGLP